MAESGIWADLDRWGMLRLAALLSERGILGGDQGLVDAVAPLPKYRRLVAATEVALERHGVLAGSGDPLSASALAAEIDAVARRLEAHRPAYDGAIELVAACVPRWLDVARGEVPGTDVLFPEGRLDRVIGYYAGHPLADRSNRATAEAVRAAVDRLAVAASGGPVRVLEVGAGTGMTTEAVLAALEARRPMSSTSIRTSRSAS